MLRSASRPDSLVLLTLFPPKAAPGQRRNVSIFYLATTGQVLGADPALYGAIEADLIANPGHSLGLVVNEPLPIPADWGTCPEHFGAPGSRNGQPLTAVQQQAEREQRCAAWVSGSAEPWCSPRQWGASIEHIAPCHWLFEECDREGMAPANQLALAVAVFGVEPTFSIHTGGKSIHCYFRLDQPISPDRFRELQGLVIAAYQHLDPACSVDESLKKPNQVLRLAGGCHPRTGQIASIYGASNTVIKADALEARLRALLPPPPAQSPLPSKRPRRPLAAHHRGRSAPTLRDIADAMARIPPFASGQGQRAEFIRFVGGVRAAVREAGGSDEQALALVMAHSPGVLDAATYWRTNWNQISAGSLWHQAGGHPAKHQRRERQQVRP